MAVIHVCKSLTKLGKPCPTKAVREGLCIGHWTASLPPEERKKRARAAGSNKKPRARRVDLSSPWRVLRWLEHQAHLMADPRDAAKLVLAALACQKAIRELEAAKNKGSQEQGHRAVAS